MYIVRSYQVNIPLMEKPIAVVVKKVLKLLTKKKQVGVIGRGLNMSMVRGAGVR